MGIYKRKLGNREASNRMLSRRSLHIAREMNVGEKINSEDIIVIRPGNGIEPKYICCLLATAPLMQPQDIYMAYKKLINEKRTYVFAASTFPSSIYRSLFFDKTEGNLRICFPGKFKKNINNFTEVFYDVGQFYWGKKETWLQKKNVFSSNSTIVKIPRWRAQDINTKEDWNTAQQLIRAHKNET